MPKKFLEKVSLITLLSLIPSKTVANDILPFTPLKEISYPERAESVRELATFVLEAHLPSTKQSCWTNLSNDKAYFSLKEILYQACRVTLHFPEGIYTMTVVNQNEFRKDEEQKNIPSQADYLALSFKENGKPFRIIGIDDFLDGWAEIADQEEFYGTINKLKKYFETL
ncbi:MAG: hypothetical protein Q8R18_00845 [bacterium]|nr:hypothetical protein [bacterium]